VAAVHPVFEGEADALAGVHAGAAALLAQDLALGLLVGGGDGGRGG